MSDIEIDSASEEEEDMEQAKPTHGFAKAGGKAGGKAVASKQHEHPSSSSTTPRHSFINHIVSILEDIDRWDGDKDTSKHDMARDVRTRLLTAMRAGMVHPYTSFYSLEASTVMWSGVPYKGGE